MTRQPARTGPAAARPTVHYYPLPDQHAAADLAAYRQHAAELAARRETDRILYARWKRRQAAIAERDRRNRAVLLGVGATVGLGLLTGLGVAGWLIWNAASGIDWGPVLVLVLLGLVLLGGVGHRCVTIVQHWH